MINVYLHGVIEYYIKKKLKILLNHLNIRILILIYLIINLYMGCFRSELRKYKIKENIRKDFCNLKNNTIKIKVILKILIIKKS